MKVHKADPFTPPWQGSLLILPRRNSPANAGLYHSLEQRMRTALFVAFNITATLGIVIGLTTWILEPSSPPDWTGVQSCSLGQWPLMSAIWAASAMVQSWRAGP